MGNRVSLPGTGPNGMTVVFASHLLMGCLKGGVGEAVRKKGFWKGCAEGTAGGAVAFAGEKMASYNMVPYMGGIGKLVHDLGLSMSDNIMRGEGYFSQFQTDLGPLNLTFRRSYVPRVTFTIEPLMEIGRQLYLGHPLDLKNSLYNFTPIFLLPGPTIVNYRGLEVFAWGTVSGNVIEQWPQSKCANTVLSHEMNHTLFWSKHRPFAEFFHPFSKIPFLERWDVG